MRIAMVGPFGFHPKKTMRARAFRLARPLVAAGHEVKLLMPPWHTPNQADRSWEEDGVQLRYTPLGGGIPGITGRLLRETIAYHPDAVHIFKPKAYSGLVGWWLWQFRRRRLRLFVDTDDWEGRGGWNERESYSTLQKHFFAWQERWGMTHAHGLTVASRTLQSLAWAQGMAPARVHYLPNGPGIDAGTIPAATRRAALGLADRPVLLLYSRLFEFDTGRLVALLEAVRSALPALAVLAVGAGLYEEDAAGLRRQLSESGLAEAVVDTGWLDEEELPATLAAADVGLYLMADTLLNRTKCPVKLADMLAVGIPVVAEAVGQVPEYVRHRETGLLRPSGDTEGLAADVIALLQDPAARKRMGAAARANIQEQFAWERQAVKLADAYQDAGRKEQE